MPSLLPRLKNFIHRFDERLAPAEKAASEAWWNLATTGTEEAQGELVRVGMAYNKLFCRQGRVRVGEGLVREARFFGELDPAAAGRDPLKTFASRQGDEGALRRIEELEAEANAIYSNHRGAVGDSLLGLRLLRRLYLRRRRAADLPDLPDNAAHRHPEDTLLRQEKRGIANMASRAS
jgi:hypothetical protein